MRKIKYTKEEVADAAKKSTCYSDVFRNLNLKINGGSYNWIKKLIKTHEIDISHFLSKKEMMNKFANKAYSMLAEELYNKDDISNGERIPGKRLLNFLLYNKIEYKCNICHLQKWNDIPLRLDVDHIDGDCTNNTLTNLQFICPNCHRNKTIPITEIPTYLQHMRRDDKIMKSRTRKNYYIPKVKSIKPPNICKTCSVEITGQATQCRSCSRTGKFNITWPSPSELQELVWEHSFVKLGKLLNVSDVAVKKHCKSLNLIIPPHRYTALKQFGKYEECLKIKNELLGNIK